MNRDSCIFHRAEDFVGDVSDFLLVPSSGLKKVVTM